MSNKSKKQIAFFFGAGVEGRGNFGIETGFDYLQKSLFASVTAKENNEKSRVVYCKVNYGNNSEVVKQIFNTINSMNC